MGNEPCKIVIDTNLWVSMAMGSRIVSEQMLNILQNPSIHVFISAELIEELTETLSKPRLQKYLSYDRSKNLFEIIWLTTQLIHVSVDLKICRDPKDDFILNLASEAHANFIITGDKDLLALNPFDNIEIVSLTSFINKTMC